MALPPHVLFAESGRERVRSRGAEAPAQGATQLIVLNRSVPAGPWTLFPSVPRVRDEESHDYYAVPNSVSFVEENGKPVFSFTRFVSNSSSGTRGAGGGILVANLQLGPPEDEVQRSLERAEERLRERDPSGKILGTAIFSDGTFRINSTVRPDGSAPAGSPAAALASRVFGEGRAPVTPGGKVAVHIKLAEDDMLKLWETFKTNAADLSITFDMNLRGYDSPISAEVFGKWDQVYSQESLQASISMPILKAQIDQAVKEMISRRELRIVGVGEGDEKFDKVVQEVIGLIEKTVFSPIALLSDVGRQTSTRDAPSTPDARTQAGGGAQTPPGGGSSPPTNPTNAPAPTTPPRPAGPPSNAPQSGAGAGGSNSTGSSPGAPPRTGTTPATPPKPPAGGGSPTPRPPSGSAAPSGSTASSGAGGKPADSAVRIEAQFTMREEHQSGELYFTFKKYRPTTIAFPITQVLAGLDRYMDDDTIFRTTNLDDTFLQQREIAVILDGTRSSDFADYINFANVQLRKTHESGEITDREIRIDRSNFNKDPNAFRMVYGWRGDNDRTRWLDYESRTIWSFFGGSQIEEPWKPGISAEINVVPPFDRTTVQVGVMESDGFEKRGIRAAVVDVFYRVGDQEKDARATVKRGDQPTDRTLDLIRPKGDRDFEYQVVYLLPGGQNLDTGRRKTSVPLLFLDDIYDATRDEQAASAPAAQ